MTIKELAEASGVDETTIGRIERGVTKNPSKANDIQKALGIGIYKRPEADITVNSDPRLSEATVGDLLGALAARFYGREPQGADSGRGRSGASDLITPRYDGSRYGSAEEAERANRAGEVG